MSESLPLREPAVQSPPGWHGPWPPLVCPMHACTQLLPGLTDIGGYRFAFFLVFVFSTIRAYFESCVIPTFDLDISNPIYVHNESLPLGFWGTKIQSTVFSM